MAKHAHPLTASHYDNINAALSNLADANELIRKAQLAGMDVRPHQEMVNYYRQHLEGLKQQFFPAGRPT